MGEHRRSRTDAEGVAGPYGATPEGNMKVPLSEQIDTLELLLTTVVGMAEIPHKKLTAALSTLRWVEKHLAELRVLAEFPGAEVREVGE
jgi:hypothetical protein